MKKDRWNRLAPILLLSLALVLLLAAAYLYRHQSPAGERRQQTEESIAEEYLLSAAEKTEEAEHKEDTDASSEAAEGDSDSGTDAAEEAEETSAFSDDHYYERNGVKYTPDYAKGYLDCVLEIPSISLRRGVYTGTWEEINYDLDIWMVVTARPDYELGKTHYVIYGHNHTEQNLSFNRLRDVQVGDAFTLTKDDTVYRYRVTDFFAEWRELVASDYADNFDRPADACYIVTCGRDEYRYKDIVVVGTLIDEEGSDADAGSHPENPDSSAAAEGDSEAAKEATHFQVAKEGDSVRIRLLSESGTELKEGEVGIFSEDGIFLQNADGPLRFSLDQPVTVSLSELSALTSHPVIGAISQDSAYAAPADMVLTIGKQGTDVTAETVGREAVPMTEYLILGGFILVGLAILVGLIFAIVRAVKWKKEAS